MRKERADLFEYAFRIDGAVDQFHPAGLDFREVENVVEQGQQGVAGVNDGAGILLGFGQGVARHHLQLAHAENGIHRRAQFMRHGGKKTALGEVCGLGRFLGIAQGRFMLLRLRDVDEAADVVAHRAAAVENGANRQALPVEAAVVAAADPVATPFALQPHRAPDLALRCIVIATVGELARRSSDCLALGVAGDLGERRIDAHDAPLGVGNEDGVEGFFEDPRGQFVGVACALLFLAPSQVVAMQQDRHQRHEDQRQPRGDGQVADLDAPAGERFMVPYPDLDDQRIAP